MNRKGQIIISWTQERCSDVLIIREMQIKLHWDVIFINHIGRNPQVINTSCQWSCMETGPPHTHRWWECKLLYPSEGLFGNRYQNYKCPLTWWFSSVILTYRYICTQTKLMYKIIWCYMGCNNKRLTTSQISISRNIYMVILGSRLRALLMLGRNSTTWTMPQSFLFV
jgi:hypothetical protein